MTKGQKTKDQSDFSAYFSVFWSAGPAPTAACQVTCVSSVCVTGPGNRTPPGPLLVSSNHLCRLDWMSERLRARSRLKLLLKLASAAALQLKCWLFKLGCPRVSSSVFGTLYVVYLNDIMCFRYPVLLSVCQGVLVTETRSRFLWPLFVHLGRAEDLVIVLKASLRSVPVSESASARSCYSVGSN